MQMPEEQDASEAQFGQLQMPIERKAGAYGLFNLNMAHFNTANVTLHWPGEQGSWQLVPLQPERDATENLTRLLAVQH